MAEKRLKFGRNLTAFSGMLRPTEGRLMASGYHYHEQSQMRTIGPQKKGQKPITFREGGLHASTGTKAGAKIPAAKHAAAAAGTLGPKAKKQETFFRNVLSGKK